jgi:Methyltransferase domain
MEFIKSANANLFMQHSRIDWKFFGRLLEEKKIATISRIAWSKLAALNLYNRREMEKVNKVCIGYSKPVHWKFFHWLMKRKPCRNILVIGVYYGRDMAYICSAKYAVEATAEQWHITGVDLFEDAATPDWPEQLKSKTWIDAGLGPAPTLKNATNNLEQLGFSKEITLLQARGEDYLKNAQQSFDFIYIDSSHDYQTTAETIALAKDRLSPTGAIAGDDYFDLENYRVESAVKDAFIRHSIFGGYIWHATRQDYR